MDVLELAHQRTEPFAAALSLNPRQCRSENQDDANEDDDHGGVDAGVQ
jgi:hypothetical protein